MPLMAIATVAYVLWWGSTPTVMSDTIGYQVVARDLGDLVIESLHDRTPGYPVVLALTASTTQVTVALLGVQLMFHLLAVWMTLLLARRFSLSTRGDVVLAALLLSPPLVEKAAYAGSEATTEVLIVGSAWLLVRWFETRRRPYAAAAGILLALAAVTRPTYQALGLLLALAAFIALWRHRPHRVAMLDAAALAVGSIVLIGGLTLFNAVRFDFPGMSPLLGWNLTTKTVTFIDELPEDDRGLRSTLVEARDADLVDGESHTGVMYIWNVKETISQQLGMSPAAADRYMIGLNLGLIARHPLNYMQSVTTASGAYLLPSATDKATGGRSIVQLLWAVLHLVVLASFSVQLVAVPGLFLARRLGADPSGAIRRPEARATWLVALTLVAYTAVISTAFEVGNPRYRTPTDPLILLLAVGGASMARSALRARGQVRAA